MAVRAYRLARRRVRMQRSVEGRNAAKNLAEDYPEFYAVESPGKGLVFIGTSADEVLEGYLKKIGEKRRSKLWYSLACVVVARGERDETEI